MASGDTKTESYLRAAAEGTRADLPSDTCCNTKTQNLILGVANRIMDVEDEVEELKNNPDVADIVATYADLQAYDTSQLTDKDIIRVLQDETRDGDSTYYRWSTATSTWTYIGESKQYTDFVGTDGTTAGEAGLVPAPATTDAGKFLKADGTWDTAGGGGPTVVQTTGDSTTDVMSQDATTKMIYKNKSKLQIVIGNGATAVASGNQPQVIIGSSAKTTSGTNGSVALGPYAESSRQGAIAVGGESLNTHSTASGTRSISIGAWSTASGDYSIALGAGSAANSKGQMDISTGSSGSNGYNNSSYRLLTGLYDPQNDHDAATKGYVDGLVGDIEAALNAINNGGGN